ncbi:glycosyltransferase family 4 protein [Pedobacter sp. P351]|uniref:glycosyltransferase family 4 protein n=1 Tax=Pedobacter superstes TaxID=3133441 RepID=UPI0030A1ED71
MKVAVINTYNAKDIKKWSGIPYHISLFLDSFFEEEVAYINLPELNRGFLSYLRGFYYNRLLKKRYYTWADENFISNNLSFVRDFLDQEFDLIITFEFYLVPLLKTKNNKVIHWNDGTFENLHNFYSGYSNFSNYSFKAAHLIQKRALDLSDTVIYSSDWAIDSAVTFYKTDKNKFKKILFASNFKINLTESELDNFISVREKGIVKLLFLTADWERKGGPDAIAVLNRLNEQNLKAFLYVVGTDLPEIYKGHKNIIHYGFINKNSGEGEEKLVRLFRESSFLIMPTRVDTTPVVFSEANSFALPVISTNVGAIASVIEKNINGNYFEISEFVEMSSDFIKNNLPGTDQYYKLCRSSFDFYKSNMSWENVEEQFRNIVKNLTLSVEN